MSLCPRCGCEVAVGQEYCLQCGLRMPGRARFGSSPLEPRRLAAPLLATAVLALVGAATAIALTRDAAPRGAVIMATGGSVTLKTPASEPGARLTVWPARKNGWTNVLVSVPKLDGRGAALARAEQARQRGLPQVGVLDSSRYASLHPGYWLVFSGVYATEAEAASSLQKARSVQRRARIQRVAS